MPLTNDEGTSAVKLARETLEAHVKRRALPPRTPTGVFSEMRGVFVTLNKEESGALSLRGCIGYSEGIKPLGKAIQDVTVFASEDPRFPAPVDESELKDILVEVSVLTQPQPLSAEKRVDLPNKLRLGVDGVIVSNQYTSGLFLPQVATDQGWDQVTYLSEACAKAGLPMDAWLDAKTVVQVFQAEVFGEVRPRGDVRRTDQVSPN